MDGHIQKHNASDHDCLWQRRNNRKYDCWIPQVYSNYWEYSRCSISVTVVKYLFFLQCGSVVVDVQHFDLYGGGGCETTGRSVHVRCFDGQSVRTDPLETDR